MMMTLRSFYRFFYVLLGLSYGLCANAEEVTRHYLSDDPLRCEVLRFACPEQQQPFFNAQGCGCELAQAALKTAPPYYSTDALKCSTLEFTCREGFYPFFDQQGCGCQRVNATDCAEMTTGILTTLATRTADEHYLQTALKPRRRYLFNTVAACQTATFQCETGYYPFFDAQGCGCQTVPTCPKITENTVPK
ncbi:hypothetical protein [Beggiatoa leptomitoformis]|uniref:Uncharacterized protein n=1 Tax=Beggiatoa leptomitoformis TaxID=288004 RepID=A0A2N9YBF3_9GAMM|nr:hypothetical protein [Beggiatoa leptomitoformis]ALG66878.1 hypothetical protein AL038_03050 [Beggiatoa leptomitoformis]AUI67764.1 hypothetical protein BLE401_02990 [Beggiatoa leptomitoformis]